MLDKVKKIGGLVIELVDYLKTVNIEVIPIEWCDDHPNEYYSAPRCVKLDKYGYYDEHVIQKLEDGKITAYGCTEGNDNEKVLFEFGDLTTDELCELIEYIK